MEEDVKTIGDYLDALKRRKWSLVLPIVILFVIAFAVALLYPRTYRSTSTILIEDQDIPAGFRRQHDHGICRAEAPVDQPKDHELDQTHSRS